MASCATTGLQQVNTFFFFSLSQRQKPECTAVSLQLQEYAIPPLFYHEIFVKQVQLSLSIIVSQSKKTTYDLNVS